MERYFEINERGHNIRCKIYCRDVHTVTSAVIFGHGFGGHKDNNAAARFAEKLTAKHKKSALITFDWPCHGDDVKKKLYLEDCGTYLELVVEYIRNRFGTDTLYAYGTSFGGYLFLKYISEKGNPFRAIALRCPAVNIYESLLNTIMTAENRSALPKGKDVPVGFDRKVPVSMAFMEELKNNDIRQRDFLDYAEQMLILHGTNDEIIPYDEAYRFSDDQLIEFIPVEGADHRFRDPVKMDLSTKYILAHFGIQG